MKSRSRVSVADVDFSGSGRQAKQLIALDNVSYFIGNLKFLERFQFTFTSDMRVGLVGPDGSGKTTLLQLLRGDLHSTSGEIRRADSLKIVRFDQNRKLDPHLTSAACPSLR